MCRFALYHGPALRLSMLLTDPVNSIIHQSFHSRDQDDPLNGDGFGIAWFAHGLSPVPALFRSVSPAWNNQNLLELARVVESRVILAHVRAASKRGGQSEANCHPFRSGPLLFMHNGEIGDFARIRRPLLASLSDAAFDVIAGTTDSEHLFAVLVDELERRGQGGADAAEPRAVDRLAAAMCAAIRRVLALVHRHGPGAPSYLNLAVSDGEHAVACRFTDDPDSAGETLFVHTGHEYVCEDGVCRMVPPDSGAGCVLVASEPLSDDPGWDEVPPNSLVKLLGDARVEVVPIGAVEAPPGA